MDDSEEKEVSLAEPEIKPMKCDDLGKPIGPESFGQIIE